jgi:hypothetical protein
VQVAVTRTVPTDEEREAHHNEGVDKRCGEAAVKCGKRHSPSRHAEIVMPYWTTALAGGDKVVDEGRWKLVR